MDLSDTLASLGGGASAGSHTQQVVARMLQSNVTAMNTYTRIGNDRFVGKHYEGQEPEVTVTKRIT